MDFLITYTHHSALQVINGAVANFNTLQITTAPAKPFADCCLSNSRSLATASDGDI
jgi:hypothetical protein